MDAPFKVYVDGMRSGMVLGCAVITKRVQASADIVMPGWKKSAVVAVGECIAGAGKSARLTRRGQHPVCWPRRLRMLGLK